MCALKAKKIEYLDIPAKTPKRKTRDWEKSLRFDHNRLYESLQEYREDNWRKRVKAFEANPDSVYNAYWYVATHPMFYSFKAWPRYKKDKIPAVHERHLDSEAGWEAVRITPHMVNPADDKISDDEHLNTKIAFWFEFGPTLFRERMGAGHGMDHTCMGGANTYDEAIVKVAKAIHKAYGNDRRQVMKKWNDPELPTEEQKNGKRASNQRA